MPDGPAPSGGRTAEELRALADRLRDRVDLFGKALAGIATIGTGAVGLTKIGELFPVAEDDQGWLVTAVVGLVAAAGAAIVVAVRLMKVSEPVIIRADLDGLADESEIANADRIFRVAAERFGYGSLTGLQARERTLRQAAARATNSEERARRLALADEVKSEIEQALARAQVATVRSRAVAAVNGRNSWICYALVILGLVFFALGTDAVASDRTDAVATAKACGEARKAGATAEDLKGSACAVATGSPAAEEEPSAEEARADLVAGLSELLKTCTGLAPADPESADNPQLTDEDCEALRAAMVEILER